MLKNKTVFMFDVDGTLSPPRQQMTSQFSDFFFNWMTDKNVYLVSGSDISKLRQQVPDNILNKTSGIFASSGNSFYINGNELQYSKSFSPTRELLDYLNDHLNHKSKYKLRFGSHIESRPGMINFSVVGRNANKEQRSDYHLWDMQNKERGQIAKHIRDNYPDIEAVLGGEISIDIYPKGNDKSQVLEYIDADSYVFFGDKMKPGGNDYSLAKELEQKTNFSLYGVTDFENTWKILKSIYSEVDCNNKGCESCECR